MAGTALQPEPPVFTLPLSRTAPTVDGRIGDEEWAAAAQFTGFIGMAEKEYFQRQGRVWLTWTREALYMAYRCRFPAGRQTGGAWDEKALRAFVRERDGRVFADDSVELYLAPEKQTRFIHFIGNSLGTIMDRRFGDVDWRGDWQFENRLDDAAGVWQFELRIAFSSLGVDPPRNGTRWFINVARTWRGTGRAFTSLTGDYRRGMARATFSDNGPAVREIAWGRPLAGRIEPDIRIAASGGDPVEVDCQYAVLDRAARALPGAAATKHASLDPGGEMRFQAASTIARPGAYAVRLVVTDRGSGRVVHSRLLPFGIYRPIGLDPFYVLETGTLGVLADFSRLPVSPVDSPATARFRVLSGSREIALEVLDPVAALSVPVYFRLDGDRPPGDLEISCRLTCGGEAWEETVVYGIPPRPDWLGKYEVDDDTVPFPWPPLRVEAGPTIACWNRRYVFGADPLPVDIRVGGKSILAGPIALNITSPEGEPVWEKGPVEIIRQAPGRIVLAKRGRIASIALRVETAIEFDGFAWTTIRLDPDRPTDIDRIRIELPVPAEIARFFHVNGEWGEKLFGAVSRRGRFPVLQEERNYHWLGNDHVGLCWLTDSFAGWQAPDPGPRIGFEKKDGQWIGFLSPWRHRARLATERTVSFGFQATPTRPPPRRPIRALLCYNTPPERLSYPVAGYGDTVVEMSLKGKMNYPPFPKDAERIRSWIAGYEKKGMKFLIYQYIDGGTETDAYERYWGDWVTRMPPDRVQWRTVTAKCCLASSWSDYYCRILDTMMGEYGASGIYLDGVMARPCQRGTYHGKSCSVDRWPILVAREHFKKVLTIARRHKGEESILLGHVSLGTIAPLAGLMDAHLKGENYGAPLSYDDMTPDVLRAEFGRQWGPQSIILPQLTKKQAIPIGRFLGITALHGIHTAPSFLPPEERTRILFPMWEAIDEMTGKGAEFHPYFEQESFVEKTGRPVSFYLDRNTG